MMDADSVGIKFTIHDHRVIDTKSNKRYADRISLSLCLFWLCSVERVVVIAEDLSN